MKKNLLYILAIVALLISCSDEQVNEVSPFNGEDVKFSVNLGDSNNSRTLYGDEDGSSIRVNWVHGDNITVYGTTCSVQQANYSVNTKDKNGDIQSGLNYATTLDKTGAAGVQWGTATTSDFYAVYPAVEGAFVSNTDGTITVTTQVAQNQKNKFTLVGNTWVGTPYVDDLDNPSMSNALMYAYTPGAKSNENNGIVNLTFKPFSTVLKFKLNGWEVKNDMTEDVGSVAVVTVNKITIKAPVSVAGTCDFTFDNGTPTVSGGEYTDIVIYPNQLLLKQGQSVEFNAFAIPQKYAMTSGEPWTVIVETDYGTYNYKIAPSADATLAEGQIHKINIPNIQINQGAVDLEPSEWMRWIPRNVYLSELSLPGAWYATNSDYQSTTDLSAQYAAGIRAFNIDCRMTYLVGTSGEWDLYCSGSEKHNSTQSNDGKTVLAALQELAKLLPNENPEEYIVAVLTVAEKEKTSSGISMGSVDPATVIAKMYDVLSGNASDLKLYTEPITANTTLNDVLGKMIVKINVNSDVATFTKFGFWESYSTTNYALVSEGSMSAVANTTSNITKANFKTMNSAPMYWGNNLINNPELIYYYHQAQRTYSTNPYTDTSIKADDEQYLGVPTLDERIDAIDEIIDNSSKIYASGKHNAWYQLGIGGYIRDRKFVNFYISSWWDDDGEANWKPVATSLNQHVLTKIEDKLINDPSPVGIVLMNFCTDNGYKSVDLTNAIIKMNTKFHLNRDMTEEEWPNGNPYNPGQGEDNGES